MPRKETKTREDELIQRVSEIEEKYRHEDEVLLGEATPDELRELGAIVRELHELRPQQPEEATV